MTAIDVMTTRLAEGDSKEEAATFAYKTLAMPMLTGTFVTTAGFVPIGFARCGRGIYVFDLRRRNDRADRLLVRGGAVCPAARRWLLKTPTEGAGAKPNLSCAHSARSSSPRCGSLDHYRGGAGLLRCIASGPSSVPRQFFPALDRPELLVDLTLSQNASIFASEEAAAKLDAILKDDPDVASWSTYVGRGAIRFYFRSTSN